MDVSSILLIAAVVAGVPVPEAPSRPAIPSAFPAAPPAAATPSVPPELAARRDRLSLADVLEIALATDASTRIAWLRARETAAETRSRTSAYWPSADLNAVAARARTSGFGGRVSNIGTTYGPQLAVDWILLDFGERRGDVEEARREALAAVWGHGAAVQDTILRTVQAYVAYVGEKASLEAARTSETEAAQNLEAAERRRAAGLATIADVLQAKTALSQATLEVQTIEGGVATLRGALATAMGLPANVTFDVLPLPAEVPAVQVRAGAEELLARAAARRPDLAEARELWQAAEANVRKVRGEGLPRLSLAGTVGRTWYDPSEFASSADTWSVGLLLRVPLFTGFKNRYDVVVAREQAAQAAEAARQTERDVVLDVWSASNDLATAAQRIATSRDLLASAEESEKVALGRYKEGVGTILDLLAAQATLARARALEISARADWIVAAARLARATGALVDPAAVPGVPGPVPAR